MKKFFLPVFFVSLLFSACYYDNLEDLYPKNPLDSLLNTNTCDTSVAVSYTKDIKPILDDRCGTSSCHSATSASGIDLSAHDKVTLFTSLNADGSSVLYSVVNWDDKASVSKMPKGASSKMDDCSLAKIRLWIKAGAPNN